MHIMCIKVCVNDFNFTMQFHFFVPFIIFPLLWLAKYTWAWHLSIRIIPCAITSPVSDYMPDSCSMNMLVRKGAHTLVNMRALIHTHVDSRRRLKRSRASIALAINALSASVSHFCLSLQNAQFRIIDADVRPLLASTLAFLDSPSPYFANSSGCNFVFWRRWVCFSRAAVSDNSSSGLHFWIFPMAIFAFNSLRFCLIHASVSLYGVQKYFEIAWQNIAVNFINKFELASERNSNNYNRNWFVNSYWIRHNFAKSLLIIMHSNASGNTMLIQWLSLRNKAFTANSHNRLLYPLLMQVVLEVN